MNNVSTRWTLLVLAAVAGCLSMPTAPCAQEKGGSGTFEDALSFYRERLGRPSFWKRTQGRRKLAAVADPRAFELLLKDYERPEAPKDAVRSTVLTLFEKHFGDAQFQSTWQKLRKEYRQPKHARLFRNAVFAEMRVDADLAMSIFEDRLPMPLRVAALAALKAHRGRKELPPDEDVALFTRMIEDKRLFGPDREFVTEAVLAQFVTEDGDPDFSEAQHALLVQLVETGLGKKRLSMRAKLAQSRLLARIFGRDNIGADPAGWLSLLSDRDEGAIEVDFARRRAAVVPTFLGIPDVGQNIVYVIDASDSMLKPLSERERGLLTGSAQDDSKVDPRVRAASSVVDWGAVKTRFQAARELVKASLRQLRPEQRFAVVLFGSQAFSLQATPKLMEPKAKVLEAVIAELDGVLPGPAVENRPHGTLHGLTNLHGGLRRALAMTTKKPLKKDVDVAIKRFAEATDTIYLISDGAPSWDDYPETDTADEGDNAGDPETGARVDYTGPLTFYGPFVLRDFLIEDLDRVNMLRRCAIHAVGLGEAEEATLRRIVDVGGGGAFIHIR